MTKKLLGILILIFCSSLLMAVVTYSMDMRSRTHDQSQNQNELACEHQKVIYKEGEGYDEYNEYCECRQGKFLCQEVILRSIALSANPNDLSKLRVSRFYSTDTANKTFYGHKIYLNNGSVVDVTTEDEFKNFEDLAYFAPSEIGSEIIRFKAFAAQDQIYILSSRINPDENRSRKDMADLITNTLYVVTPLVSKKEIWNTKAAGAINDFFLPGRNFLELDIDICETCAPKLSPGNTIIVNMNTGKQKWLGSVGALRYNFKKGQVQYQKLKMVDLPCTDPDVWEVSCNGTMGKGMKPKGQIYTTKLP